jgi:hypothetical protein
MMFVIPASSFIRHSLFELRHSPHVEADDAVSKKEFLKNIGTCPKEARETKHFLRMIVRAVPELKPQAGKLWIEAKELHLIFSKIWRSGI